MKLIAQILVFKSVLSNGRGIFLPETPRRRTLKCRAIVEQISIQMNAYVCLKAVWKAFQHHVHINAIGVRPGML